MARIVSFFTEDWALKLTALALAVLLWMTFRADTPQLTEFRNTPIEVDLRDPDWRLEGRPEPSTVDVTIAASTSELWELAANRPRIVLPLERVNDTTETQVVPPQWVRLPPGVDPREARVISIRPDTVRLDFERLATKSVPVRVRTSGDLPRGLALALPIQTNPAAVQVRGPAAALEQLDSIPLRPVELSGLRSTTNVPAAIDTAAVGAAFRFDPREVNVVLRVMPADSQPGLTEDSLRARSGAPF